MDEGEIDHARYGWGAEEWVHDSQVVVEETTRRGMSVSLTSGTNWSNANLPTITPITRPPRRSSTWRTRTLPRRRRAAARCRASISTPSLRPTSFPGIAARSRSSTSSRSSPHGSSSARRCGPRRRIRHRPHRPGAAASPWSGRRPRGRVAALRLLDARHGQTASPSASVNYTVNYLDRDGVDAVIDYWDSVVLTPELREQIAAQPAGADVHGLPRAVDLRRRRACSGAAPSPTSSARRRGYDLVPWLPFLTRTAPLMAVSTVYHYEPREARPRHGREGALRLRAHAHRPLHREHAASVRRVPARESGMSCAPRSATACRSSSRGRARRWTGSRPSRWSSARRSTPTGCWPGPRTCSASSTRPRRARPPATTSSTTASTTRSSPPSSRRGSRRRCCTAGRARPAPRASRGGPGTRACGRCSPSGSTRVSPARSSTRCGTTRSAATSACCGRAGRASTSGSCAPTTSPTTSSGLSSSPATASASPTRYAYGRMWMRDRENHWWQDLGMQDAGWTYEFFDGSLLLHEDVAFAGRARAARRPGLPGAHRLPGRARPGRRGEAARVGAPGPARSLVVARRARARVPAGRRRTSRTSAPPSARRDSTVGTTSSPRRWRLCSRCRPSRRSTTRPRRRRGAAERSASPGAPSSPATTGAC